MTNWAVSLALATLAMAAAVHAADVPSPGETQLNEMRATVRAVLPDVEKGNWRAAEDAGATLSQYVLWPDLRAAYFRAKIRTEDHGAIESFLDEHGILKPARELRYRYALHLAEEGRLDEYFQIYQQYYQGLEIAKLDCLALQAELAAGRQTRIVSRGLDLWMVGTSQADECDPVFAHLQASNVLTADQFAARYSLAIESRRFSLARYLSRPLDPSYRLQADTWQAAQDDSRAFLTNADQRVDEDVDRRQLVYATMRVAYRDPLAAHQHWNLLKDQFSFSAADRHAVSRHIALWSARLHLPEATGLLSALPAAASNEDSRHWLVRANLLSHQWAEVVRAIDAMPADESSESEWQYWKAVALRELGDTDQADAILSRVAAERSYHGFLAADAIGAPYVLDIEDVSDNPAIAARIAEIPGVVRARELFHVGLEGRGRSEWDAEISVLTDQEQLQAALLAHGWGWHSRAISTVASAGAYDDLQIRYPLPWQEEFEQHAGTAGIPRSWAYGIARSESLFMRDIRSSAGAVGLMQLMPETGRMTARELNLPYSGIATLTDSSSNIRLGTWYLGKMYSRFDGNRVLATAAYNAGPHRVDRWLPDSGSLDARIWIENIPFNETRGYVRRVLTDEAIFHWRITGRERRISDELPQIVAASNQAGAN